MSFDFLLPIKDSVVAHLVLQSSDVFGKKIKIHTSQEGFPDLDQIQLAILGV